MALESQVVPAPTLAAPRNLREALVLALAYGRKLHKADQKFSQWCKDEGFGDIPRRTRADAMWMVENCNSVGNDSPPGLTHPHAIRAAVNTHAAASLLPADLAAVEVTPEDTIKLAYGRKLHKADKKFSQWCKEQGSTCTSATAAPPCGWPVTGKPSGLLVRTSVTLKSFRRRSENRPPPRSSRLTLRLPAVQAFDTRTRNVPATGSMAPAVKLEARTVTTPMADTNA